MSQDWGLYRRKGSKVWTTNFEVEGVRVHRSTHETSITRARIRAKEIQEEVQDELHGRIQPEAATLRTTLDAWCTARAGAFSARHIRNVRSAIRLHMRGLLDLSLDQVDTAAVEGARTAYLTSRGTGHRPGQKGRWSLEHTAGGANKIVQHLSSVLGWAVTRGDLAALPFRLAQLLERYGLTPPAAPAAPDPSDPGSPATPA